MPRPLHLLSPPLPVAGLLAAADDKGGCASALVDAELLLGGVLHVEVWCVYVSHLIFVIKWIAFNT